MLLHLRPRIYAPLVSVGVLDISVPRLDLFLQGNDLATRRPYPNKRLSVACRPRGRKAIDGIFIETGIGLDHFDCITRWAVGSVRIVTHKVSYTVLDTDFDAASDDMGLWYGYDDGLVHWKNRYPPKFADFGLLRIEPIMEVGFESEMKHINTLDTFDERSDLISVRRQTFEMPTIERSRLLSHPLENRLPAIADAFMPLSAEALAELERRACLTCGGDVKVLNPWWDGTCARCGPVALDQRVRNGRYVETYSPEAWTRRQIYLNRRPERTEIGPDDDVPF